MFLLNDVLLVIKTVRLNFLLLTPVCVFLGASPVLAGDQPFSWMDFSLILIGALLAHASVNMLNEYFDFKSGLDMLTSKTAFSGGTGTLPDHPEIAPYVLRSGLAALLITMGIGVYFIVYSGWQLLVVGLTGVALILFYTGPINRSPLLCLLAPGTGFGLLMVIGTQIALLGELHAQYALLSLVPMFLVSNLLLLNQYPDIEADRSVGRRHLPIVHGIVISNRVYLGGVLLTLIAIMFYVSSGFLSPAALLASLPMLLAFVAYRGARQYGALIGEHPAFLAANVLAALTTPLFLGLLVVFA